MAEAAQNVNLAADIPIIQPQAESNPTHTHTSQSPKPRADDIWKDNWRVRRSLEARERKVQKEKGKVVAAEQKVVSMIMAAAEWVASAKARADKEEK